MNRLTKNTSLRPVLAGDMEWLYLLSLADGASAHWRYRGRTPSPHEFSSDLWSGVHCQYVVCERASGVPVGLTGLSNLDSQAAHAEVFALGEFGRGSLALEGAIQVVDYAFEDVGLNKLWIKALKHPGSGGGSNP